MRDFSCVFLLLTAASIGIAADRSVKGQVFDIVTGEVLPGASITFFQQTGDRTVKTVVAGPDGAYTVTLPDGTYVVVATKTDGVRQRELRRFFFLSADTALNLRLGARHSPGGEFARIIFGLDQAAATSANSTFKYFFDLHLSAPLAFEQTPDPDFGPRWRLWGSIRSASIPQQVTSRIATFNLPGEVANLQVNELAQSMEFRGGLLARIAASRSLKLSFDKDTLQKFSLHLLAGLGASTPINPRDTLEVFRVSPEAIARYPQAAGKELIGFTSADRDRFYRQAFGGFEVRAHYFDKDTETALDRFPATFSITYGIDEAVTQGYIRGGVFRAEGFYPLPTRWGSQFYFFFTTMMKPSRVRTSEPLLLEPAYGVFLAEVIANGVRVSLPPIDRDYYRVGFGMDMMRLIQNIQNMRGEPRPESR
jgi:hypothetical protein